jgi:hypothetical protein
MPLLTKILNAHLFTGVDEWAEQCQFVAYRR